MKAATRSALTPPLTAQTEVSSPRSKASQTWLSDGFAVAVVVARLGGRAVVLLHADPGLQIETSVVALSRG